MRKTKTRTVTRYVKAKRRRRKGFTIPIAIVGGFMPGIAYLWSRRHFGAQGMIAIASRIYLGWASTRRYGYGSGKVGFAPDQLKLGTLPIIAGFLVHWLVGNKLGVNRILGRTGIPILRI